MRLDNIKSSSLNSYFLWCRPPLKYFIIHECGINLTVLLFSKLKYTHASVSYDSNARPIRQLQFRNVCRATRADRPPAVPSCRREPVSRGSKAGVVIEKNGHVQVPPKMNKTQLICRFQLWLQTGQRMGPGPMTCALKRLEPHVWSIAASLWKVRRQPDTHVCTNCVTADYTDRLNFKNWNTWQHIVNISASSPLWISVVFIQNLQEATTFLPSTRWEQPPACWWAAATF